VFGEKVVKEEALRKTKLIDESNYLSALSTKGLVKVQVVVQ